jgi:hypothetical protein
LKAGKSNRPLRLADRKEARNEQHVVLVAGFSAPHKAVEFSTFLPKTSRKIEVVCEAASAEQRETKI